jgi:K+-transporting ATPase ATPase A chain
MTEFSNTESMTWQHYSKSLLLFNLFSGIIIFLILRLQHILPLNPLGFPGIEPLQAFNIVSGYTTNTDWQSFSGELTISNLTQMIALTFGMMVGTMSGVSVYIAFIRGLVNKPLGHFYRIVSRLLFTYCYPSWY